MNSKERMWKSLRFEEPDRVPIEMIIHPKCLEMNLLGAETILDFQEHEADNFFGVSGFNWGFFGLDTSYSEEVIEDVPGQFKRIRRITNTSAGEFIGITKHTYDDLYGGGDPNDYHWEKRYIETPDDLRRLAEAPRERRPFNLDAYNQDCRKIGNRGVPVTCLLHPLGSLVRNSNMEEVYTWFFCEPRLMETFLERTTKQICDSLSVIQKDELVDPLIFRTYALEMLIPPWLGMEQFNRWVFPWDKRINDVIHSLGGKYFPHSHGNTGKYLERFADMGVDILEPLEPPPYADNDLADAKRRVGDRMVLAGNIPSQTFPLDSFQVESVREMVKQTIKAGAPGGGFFLRSTGSAYVGCGKNREQRIKGIHCGLAMIDAWREFGSY